MLLPLPHVQNGATLLTSIVSKMPDEVLAWHDQAGVPALQHILALVSNMISPQDTSESGGLAVGDVLTTLLRKRPQSLSTVLPQLCISLVTRLSSTSSTSLAQSLIIPLAFLLKDHLNTVIALLSSHWIEGTGAKERVPALHVLMTKWCEFAGTFQGFWNTRVSTLGLCAFLQQARQSGLESIVVDGDLIPDDSNMIKTRSRAKAMPHRYTQIPLPAKVLKIVVGEYSQAVDGPPSQSTGRHESPGLDGEDDDDDDADEWDDDIDYAKKQRQDAFLSDMLGEDLDGGLEALIAQHDEEQFKDDAIYNMPFRVCASGAGCVLQTVDARLSPRATSQPSFVSSHRIPSWPHGSASTSPRKRGQYCRVRLHDALLCTLRIFYLPCNLSMRCVMLSIRVSTTCRLPSTRF